MTAQCSTKRIEFHPRNGRLFTGCFDGGAITSDGGLTLLREIDLRTRMTEQLAECFVDYRDPARIQHSLTDLLRQRIYALAMGYEDLNDHDELRHDLMLALTTDREDLAPLAGKSTLNRLELGRPETDGTDRYKKIAIRPEKVKELLVDLFLQAHQSAPSEIVLDVDATDDHLHGKQEGRFYHGYYRGYCYLPLYIFCGEHCLCATLRPANICSSHGTLDELAPIVERIRRSWPSTRITVRADSGFCRERIMSWCERNGVDYIIGIAKNSRLRAHIEQEMRQAGLLCRQSGKPARLFKYFSYRTLTSWSRPRRIVAKAEALPGKENPRFIVTSLEGDSQRLYEDVYCARGEMENRIKEHQSQLFADRTSSHYMAANQVRLWFSALAYTLLETLRREGLPGTELERAQCRRIREKLGKIGAQIRVSTRRIWVSFAQGYPYEQAFAAAYARLRRWRPLRA